MSDTSSPTQPTADDPNRFKVGTITYTKAGLITLFLFLLWGDFCFTLMEIVVPSILPLKLNSIGAPNWALGLIVTTIPNIMAAVINPIISVRSDRFRSRWGRRIPFLFTATPFLVLFLILLGYARPLGAWLHEGLLSGHMSQTNVMLLVIGVLMICFQFFNLFITSVYYYLFNDVVPQAFLARFMALFRAVGAAAGAAYNFFVLKYAESHTEEIFLVSGLLYLVAFMMMCWKVREGDYPPPAAYVDNKQGFVAACRTYARECFTHRFYWYIFLANSCVAMTWASGVFTLIYKTKYLGLDFSLVGTVTGICGVIGVVLLYPAGIVADRFHPLRVLLIALGLQVFYGPFSIAYAMMVPGMSDQWVAWVYIGLTVLSLPISTLYGAAELPTLMRLFPKDRYGQFSSANALVRSGALIVGGVACGWFFDLTAKLHPDPLFSYRFLPVWNFSFQLGALFFTWLLYREWKKLGGMEKFIPPAPRPDTSVMAP